MYILKIFSKKWILFTIFIAGMMALFVYLGFWQLDRHAQKRSYNTLLAERWRQEPFDLNQERLPDDLSALEYRRITADGYFDYANQLVLKSQVYRDAPGIVLVTPFVIDADYAVLVARGWAPGNYSAPQFWPEIEEPPDAPMIGLIRPSQAPPNGAESTPPTTPQTEWYRIDIPAIQAQMPYQLASAWIQQLPEDGRPLDRMPVREEPLALDEGNHMSYAVQWFAFAVIAGFGYIMFVRFRERQAASALRNPGQAVTVSPTAEMPGEAPAGVGADGAFAENAVTVVDRETIPAAQR